MFPAGIAHQRHHHQLGAIAALNLLLGWTVLGWIGALVWAFTAVQQPSKVEAPEAR
ncbi:MAG: superinfection immunity protein [Deltaproteobacteria bacterium]|nr:superinfection immunity protein [Deltaproteobacteria bacterium]